MTVRFLFDLLSPYAYLAWHALPPLAAEFGRPVEPAPTLLPALLNHWGHKGPAEIPPKRRYVYADCLRHAALLGIPLVPPPTHPFNPLLPLRVVGVVPDDRRAEVVSALFAATWGGGGGVESPEAIAPLLAELGLDAPALLAAAVSPEGKARLKRSAQEALAAGVWGVPTMLVDGQLFWGFDSLPHLRRYLAGEDPLQGVDLDALERDSSARR